MRPRTLAVGQTTAALRLRFPAGAWRASGEAAHLRLGKLLGLFSVSLRGFQTRVGGAFTSTSWRANGRVVPVRANSCGEGCLSSHGEYAR
jgi:hypothetical protein